MNSLKMLSAGLVLAIGMVAASTSALSQEPEDLLASTTAQWWQTVNSIPATVNPLTDPTGTYCMAGQRDPMWFLMGTFGGPAARTCTVPEGEALFFPVINNFFFNTPGICGQTDNGKPDGNPVSYTAAQARDSIAPLIDAATNMHVKVDGRNVKNLMRIKSVVFATTIPADNIWNSGCVSSGLGKVPAGVYSPSVDDGYYVLLKPLSVGNHTLQIHAESGGFVLDVAYKLIVTPVELQ